MKMMHEKCMMMDNIMVKDNHQGGMSRVLQRGNRQPSPGHNGKMGMGGKAHWNHMNSSLTPKKA